MEKDGIIKEYYSNGKLRFEGEYLNIKGKECYDNGELKFLNESWNGKGKEYNFNGKLLFEGEYLNGKRWNGKVKEYYSQYNGNIKRWNGINYDEGEIIIGFKKEKQYYYNTKLYI